jgi:ERCC4-related helicase
MVQRQGRTGRQRVGRVVLLVHEGKEKQKLQSSREKSRKIIKVRSHMCVLR